MLTFPRFLLHTANLLWIVHTVPTTAQVVVVPTPTPTGSPAQNTTTVSPTSPVSTIAPTHSPSTIAPVNNVTVVPLDITNAPTPPFTSQPTETTNATTTTTTSSIGFDNTTSTAPMSTSDQPSQSPTVRTGTAITTGSDSPSLSPLDQRSTNPSSSPTDPMEVEPNIVGGGFADVGAYPFYAWSYGSTSLCGGTLIHDDIVLTAAHCDCDDAFLSGFVHIGGTARDGSDAIDSFNEVLKCLQHPNFDPMVKDVNDIMLLKLLYRSNAPSVTLNFDVAVPQINDAVTTIGYGRTMFTDDDVIDFTTEKLKEVDVDIFPDTTCDDIYMTSKDYDPALNICAGTVDGDSDSCQGDSGGPLLTKQSVQIGIVSYGDGCGKPNIPAAYTEVSAYKKFIDDGICGTYGSNSSKYFF